MMLCDNKGLRPLLCVGREKLQCKTFCHVLKYSMLLDPLLLKSKQWGIKHSCKEVGVRKPGYILLRGNWWWQSVLYLSLQLLNSLLLKLALEAKHMLHTMCTLHCVLWFLSYFSVKKENRHQILPVNKKLRNSSSCLLLFLCAMKGGTHWSYPSGRDGSSQKVKAIKLHTQKNFERCKASNCVLQNLSAPNYMGHLKHATNCFVFKDLSTNNVNRKY